MLGFIFLLLCGHRGFKFDEIALRKRYVEKLPLKETGATPLQYDF
jgi:hypothetical protein